MVPPDCYPETVRPPGNVARTTVGSWKSKPEKVLISVKQPHSLLAAVYIRGFLVVTVVRGDGGPVPALLYARTETRYRVLGRSPDTLAVVSRPTVRTRSAAASLSCGRQYLIWKHTSCQQQFNIRSPPTSKLEVTISKKPVLSWLQ